MFAQPKPHAGSGSNNFATLLGQQQQLQAMHAPKPPGGLLSGPLAGTMASASAAGNQQQMPMQQQPVPGVPHKNRPQRAATLTFIDGKWQSGL